MGRKTTFAVIGFGAVTDEILRCLAFRKHFDALTGILVPPHRCGDVTKKAAGRFDVVGSLDELLDLKPDIVIEAAGHAAVRQFGPDILTRGTDLLVASVGTLADDHFSNGMKEACASGTTLWLAAGAVAGIDGLLAARSLSPRTVKYISVKPPQAWMGTPAEAIIGAQKKKRIVFFEGNARDAATRYPQNANVAATVALASLGLDRTQVELVSDPDAPGPLGIIEAEGDFGRFTFNILALASPANPKSSAITGHSLVSAVFDGMRFRAFPDL